MVSLNDQSFHRSQGVSITSQQQNLFKMMNNQQFGGQNKIWENDAEGGFVSYTKMIYEQNQN